jgi:hypothetical protein
LDEQTEAHLLKCTAFKVQKSLLGLLDLPQPFLRRTEDIEGALLGYKVYLFELLYKSGLNAYAKLFPIAR